MTFKAQEGYQQIEKEEEELQYLMVLRFSYL